MVYLGHNRINKKKQNGNGGSKSIEPFIIVVAVSCRDKLRDWIRLIRQDDDKMIRCTLSSMKNMGVITVIHVLFTKKKCITKRVFICLSLAFLQEILEEEKVSTFDIFSTHTNFIKTITEIVIKFVTSQMT